MELTQKDLKDILAYGQLAEIKVESGEEEFTGGSVEKGRRKINGEWHETLVLKIKTKYK